MNRPLVFLAFLLGIAMIAIAVLYFAEPAHSLPSFFPGHASAGDAEYGRHHIKHGVAATVVALGSFAFAWFQSGPAGRSGSAAPPTSPGTAG